MGYSCADNDSSRTFLTFEFLLNVETPFFILVALDQDKKI